MADSVWMFAPEKLTRSTPLSSTATKVRSGSTKIESASELSIQLRYVYVHESYDQGWHGLKGGKTNDLLISSKFQTGEERTVTQVHKFLPKRKIGLNGPFIKTNICSFSDFKSSRLNVQIRIFDVDDYSKIAKTVKNANTVFSSASSIFPAITAAAGIISPVSQALVSLIDSADEHESIIDSTLQLHMQKSNMGFNVLQTAHWVCFSKPPKNAKVVTKDNKPFTGCSYAVISITNKAYKEPKWEIDQKIAKLLTEIESGKSGTSDSVIKFVSETMTGYTNYKKLERIQELEKKSKTTMGLSDTEKILLKKLQSEKQLKPFLPSS